MEKVIAVLALICTACGNLEGLTARDIYDLQTASRTSVYGLVTSARTHAPIAAATVLVGSQSAVSEGDGTYRLDGLSPGEVTGEVSVHGFQSLSTRLTLVRGPNYHKFELEPNECGRNDCQPGEFCSGNQCVAGATLSGSVLNACDDTALGALVRIDGKAICVDALKGSYFQLKELTPGGPHVISVGKIGYKPYTGTVTLNAGFNIIDTVLLTPENGCGAAPATVACVCEAENCQM
jgi:hypothetical protein